MIEENQTDRAVQVFLMIENRLVRDTLVRLFRKRSDICVAPEDESVDEVDTPDQRCAILVSDDLEKLLSMSLLPQDSGLKTSLAILLIGMEEDEEKFLLAVRSGVSGYLVSDASASDVVAAVRAVVRGEAVCPPRFCHTLFREVARSSRTVLCESRKASFPALTIHQQQIIGLVAKGLTNKEIALQLHLSQFTIRNHIHRIMRLVDAANRAEAVRTIMSGGLSLDSVLPHASPDRRDIPALVMPRAQFSSLSDL